MKNLIKLLIIPALFFVSAQSYAVNVGCYSGAAPGQIGCFTFLLSYEVNNVHNGVWTWADLYKECCGIYDSTGHLLPKPGNATTPVQHYWVPLTEALDYLPAGAVMIHGWDEKGFGENGTYEYEDWDTQDNDTASAS